MVSAEEPSRSRLDECFLMRRYQSPPPTFVTLLPRSSYEVTILWYAPHSCLIRSSASVALTSIDSTQKKGYEHLPPPGWVCGRTLLPAHSYRMEGEGEPSIQAVQSHICTCWTCLLGRLDKRLQHFTRWLCSRSSRLRCSPIRKPVWIQPLSGTWEARQTWL